MFASSSSQSIPIDSNQTKSKDLYELHLRYLEQYCNNPDWLRQFSSSDFSEKKRSKNIKIYEFYHAIARRLAKNTSVVEMGLATLLRRKLVDVRIEYRSKDLGSDLPPEELRETLEEIVNLCLPMDEAYFKPRIISMGNLMARNPKDLKIVAQTFATYYGYLLYLDASTGSYNDCNNPDVMFPLLNMNNQVLEALANQHRSSGPHSCRLSVHEAAEQLGSALIHAIHDAVLYSAKECSAYLNSHVNPDKSFVSTYETLVRHSVNLMKLAFIKPKDINRLVEVFIHTKVPGFNKQHNILRLCEANLATVSDDILYWDDEEKAQLRNLQMQINQKLLSLAASVFMASNNTGKDAFLKFLAEVESYVLKSVSDEPNPTLKICLDLAENHYKKLTHLTKRSIQEQIQALHSKPSARVSENAQELAFKLMLTACIESYQSEMPKKTKQQDPSTKTARLRTGNRKITPRPIISLPLNSLKFSLEDLGLTSTKPGIPTISSGIKTPKKRRDRRIKTDRNAATKPVIPALDTSSRQAESSNEAFIPTTLDVPIIKDPEPVVLQPGCSAEPQQLSVSPLERFTQELGEHFRILNERYGQIQTLGIAGYMQSPFQVQQIINEFARQYYIFHEWIMSQVQMPAPPLVSGAKIFAPEALIELYRQAFKREHLLPTTDRLFLSNVEQNLNILASNPHYVIDIVRIMAHYDIKISGSLSDILIMKGFFLLRTALENNKAQVMDLVWKGFKQNDAYAFFVLLRNFNFFSVLSPTVAELVRIGEDKARYLENIEETLKKTSSLDSDKRSRKLIFCSLFKYRDEEQDLSLLRDAHLRFFAASPKLLNLKTIQADSWPTPQA